MIRLDAPIITQEEYEEMCFKLIDLEANNYNGKNDDERAEQALELCYHYKIHQKSTECKRL